MKNYFFNSLTLGYGSQAGVKRKEEYINSRRQRPSIKGFSTEQMLKKGLFFQGGDILKLVFNRGGYGYYFEGLCLVIRKRHFLSKHTSLCLRNIVYGVGMEVIASYYLHRIYRLEFSDYKRKRYNYSRHKLRYLVTKVRLATAV